MRSIHRAFGRNARGVAATEQEQLSSSKPAEMPATDVEVEIEDDSANSLKADLIETAEQVGEVTELSDEIDAGLDTVEALEGYREDVRTALGNGGLNKDAVRIVRRALEGLYNGVGHQVEQVTPAIENYGGVGDRQRETIALEADIKAQTRKIWEQIVAMIQEAIKRIVEVYKRFFDGATKLENQAKQLATQLSSVDGAPAEREIENARLAKRLSLDGRVHDNADAAKRLNEVARKLFQNYGGFVEGVAHVAEQVAKGDEGSINAANEALGKLDLGFATVDAGSAGISAPEGAHIERSDELPGAQALFVVISNKGAAASVHPFGKESAGTKVPVLSKDAAEAALKEIAALAEAIKQSKPLVEKGQAAKKSLLSAVKSLEVSSEGGTQAREVLKASLSLIDGPFVTFSKYAIEAGDAVLDQVKESIKAHAAKKAEKPAEKPAE